MSFEDSQEWAMGDAAQKQWARLLAKRGNAALPVYGMKDTDAGTKAPILFWKDGLLVTPDVLSISPDLKATWHEVKAKATPGWYRKLARWEHGIDFSLIEEYEEVERATGFPVWLIVYEERSPENPSALSQLVAAGVYLGIPLHEALAVGSRRLTWPGGTGRPRDRGRRGRGGWLWPRLAMRLLEMSP